MPPTGFVRRCHSVLGLKTVKYVVGESPLVTAKCTFITFQKLAMGSWAYNPEASDDGVRVYNYNYSSNKSDDSGPANVHGTMQHITKNTLEIPVGPNKDGKCVIRYVTSSLNKQRP